MVYPANPTMKLYITSTHFILQTPDLGSSYQFVIERATGRCYCHERFNPIDSGTPRNEIYYLDVFLIVGIIPIDSVLYVVVVTAADIIDTLRDRNIYEIKAAELVPVKCLGKESDSQETQKQSICKLLSSGFYFSYYYDLTRTMSDKAIEGNLHERAEKSYYWNLELYRDFISQGVDTQWLIPIIQGYVGISTVNNLNETLLVALISRRSCERTGTRYNCRGLDDEGNVANYVETEQILITGKHAFSYLQIRGSVPLFWEQTGLTTQVALTRSQEMNTIGLVKHTQQLLEQFQSVTMLNLLSSHKSDETCLTDAWEAIMPVVTNQFQSKLFYQHFDFHAMCKGNKYSSLNSLLSDLQDFINYYMYFMESEGEVHYRQKGVIRSNCLDCLDRTNVVQSYIGWAVLVSQLSSLHCTIPTSMESAGSLAITKAFKNLWADNGDYLSFQYTGTGSTISSVTREGRQGFRGMISHGLISISRLYNANVEDAARQKSIDAMLRRRGQSGMMNQFEDAVNAKESEFATYKNFTIRAITWNVAGRKIPQDMDFTEILQGGEPADVIVLVFQEVVKLNPRNILQESNNQGAIDNIQRIIERSLFNTGFRYSILCQADLVGIGLFIYAKASLCKDITKLETDSIKVGFGGKMGNKGGVVGRFNLLDTTICVLGCHLASGNENNEARKTQLFDIHNRAFQQEKVGKQNIYYINQHDIRLICGDLNFRIPLNNYSVRSTIKEGKFKDLLGNDQLIEALTNRQIPDYKECEINFPPTYKFDFGTDIYDTSKKQRVPSWCDRILYCGDGIEPIHYDFVDVRISDHRPVVAEFNIIAKKIDEQLKKQIEEEIYSQLIPEEGEEEEAYVEESKEKIAESVDLLSL